MKQIIGKEWLSSVWVHPHCPTIYVDTCYKKQRHLKNLSTKKLLWKSLNLFLDKLRYGHFDIAHYLPNSSRAVWASPPNSPLMASSMELSCLVRGEMVKKQSHRALCDTILKFGMVLGYGMGITKNHWLQVGMSLWWPVAAKFKMAATDIIIFHISGLNNHTLKCNTSFYRFSGLVSPFLMSIQWYDVPIGCCNYINNF